MTHSEILSTREEFGNMHVAIIQAMSHLQCQRDEAQAQVSKLIAESGILSALGGTVGLLHIQEELVKAREKAEELETKLTMNDLARYFHAMRVSRCCIACFSEICIQLNTLEKHS